MVVQWLTNILDICAVSPCSEDGAKQAPTRSIRAGKKSTNSLQIDTHFSYLTESKMTYVVYQCNALDVQVSSVKRILQQFDNVMSYRISSGETFGPGQNLSRVQRCLLNRE